MPTKTELSQNKPQRSFSHEVLVMDPVRRYAQTPPSYSKSGKILVSKLTEIHTFSIGLSHPELVLILKGGTSVSSHRSLEIKVHSNDESNTYVLERFNTSSLENPGQEDSSQN
ncbi:hypothetical protein Tco_1044123 [Tanacetum coccineum]|uniref:Uncharacterized protein n=1 Tax=Tanacetum coccineum TaxID=301880 RepID=A0ABQ5GP19_9ASTR